MPEPDFSANPSIQLSRGRSQQPDMHPRRSSGLLALSLVTTVGLAGGIWLGQAAIAPQVVQAYITRVDVSVDNLPGETFETLLRRAEAVARAAAQRSFDRDILTTEVSVVVTAENEGATAPLLMLEVSRSQWRSFPDPRRWATYYRTARFLLGFEKAAPPSTSATTSTPSVQVNPVPTPSPAAPASNAPAGNTGTTTTPTTTTPGTTAPTTTPTTAPTTTPTTAPTTTPGTTPSNTPAPPTTPGTSGSTPAPGN